VIDISVALLLVLAVLAFRWWSLLRELRLRPPREERLRVVENSPWLAALVLTASLAGLAWEWSLTGVRRPGCRCTARSSS